MAFSSTAFILFFVITAVIYYAVPKALQWIVLLLASGVFYAFAGFRAALFLLFTSLSTWLFALAIEAVGKRYDSIGSQARSKEEKSLYKKQSKTRRRLLLTLCLLANFGILAFIKFSASLAVVLPNLPASGLLLPLGMSFYMFTSMGYLIDVYRGKYPAQRNFFRLSLFVSFFPQMIQGPIGRYDRMSPQLYSGRSWDGLGVKHGILLMLWGFFKKLVVADRAAVLVGTVFSNTDAYGGAILFLSIIFYSIQIYCDFSGGIDIARGAAQVLGIEMDINFRQPFFASSIADFWRRWHISLSGWLKDYLFYPITLSGPMTRLGKKARKVFGSNYGRMIPTSISTFIVYLVVGIWHGGSMKYIAFGLYNGIIITSSLFLDGFYTKARERLHIRDESRLLHAFRLLRTLLLVFIGRFFTRSDTLGHALGLLRRGFAHPYPSQVWNGTLGDLGLDGRGYTVLLIGICVVFAWDLLCERDHPPITSLDRCPFIVQYIVMLLLLLAVIFPGAYSTGYIATEFIYAQF